MSNCCLFENPTLETSRKLFDLIPVERVPEKVPERISERSPERVIEVSAERLESRERVVTEVARMRPLHEISVIRPQPVRALTGKAVSKSVRQKPTVRAFVELMLAAASLLFLALS